MLIPSRYGLTGLFPPNHLGLWVGLGVFNRRQLRLFDPGFRLFPLNFDLFLRGWLLMRFLPDKRGGPVAYRDGFLGPLGNTRLLCLKRVVKNVCCRSQHQNHQVGRQADHQCQLQRPAQPMIVQPVKNKNGHHDSGRQDQ